MQKTSTWYCLSRSTRKTCYLLFATSQHHFGKDSPQAICIAPDSTNFAKAVSVHEKRACSDFGRRRLYNLGLVYRLVDVVGKVSAHIGDEEGRDQSNACKC